MTRTSSIRYPKHPDNASSPRPANTRFATRQPFKLSNRTSSRRCLYERENVLPFLFRSAGARSPAKVDLVMSTARLDTDCSAQPTPSNHPLIPSLIFARHLTPSDLSMELGSSDLTGCCTWHA
ncbi:hypothetical protein VTJ04DRAFT_592 [Mycothermus thermophilus]|uniref:uncharacterized protein n=1 Tax=Humicola insolens TaxID=85995 RepID=UPI00374404A9